MNTSTYDFVSVEMRGLKAALVARAQAQRVSVSELVRSAVARDLGLLARIFHACSQRRAQRGIAARI